MSLIVNCLASCSNEDSITCILKNIVNTNSILKGTLQSGEPLMKCFVRKLTALHLFFLSFLYIYTIVVFVRCGVLISVLRKFHCILETNPPLFAHVMADLRADRWIRWWSLVKGQFKTSNIGDCKEVIFRNNDLGVSSNRILCKHNWIYSKNFSYQLWLPNSHPCSCMGWSLVHYQHHNPNGSVVLHILARLGN